MKLRRRPWARIGIAVVLALLIGACSGMTAQPSDADAQTRRSPGSYVEVTRGHYLARIGDCKSCHTAKGGKPWAGGRAIPTPFGVIYSTNITPDPATGIGDWSFEDFYQSMHEGVARDGRHLYPAFPYPWFTRLSRDDVHAIKAYLDTLTPVRQRDVPNELPWPFSMRSVMAVWNKLYFDAGTYQPDPGHSAEWNRGAYLVRGVGHCGACHGSKNFAGATDMDHPFRGGMAEHVYAPDLTGSRRTGLGNWSVADIVEYLGTGSNDITSAAGPMAEVVRMSTQYLSASDRRAIAVYLKSLPAARTREHGAQDENDIDASVMRSGKAVYIDDCQGCHMDGGKGIPGVFPPLRGSSAIVADKPQTLIQAVLEGARIPPTRAKPTGLQMPAFDRKLSNAEIADVLTFIRNSWGNHAGAVSEGTVGDLRDTLGSTPH
ncbi:MAG TPA: cytochrome c [Rhodanobacteraceae bacterium]|nr:cytochrome c [Rhodanobacteraceae bacterium]